MRIFEDDEDYERYIRMLGHVTVDHSWLSMSFCLMPNHTHLFIETREPNLGRGMQWLQSMYARAFNDRYERVGHLYQARFKATRVEDDVHFVTAASYVELNAVRAGLCRRPEDWPWSSAGLRGAGIVPSWLAHDALCAKLGGITGRNDLFGPLIP